MTKKAVIPKALQSYYDEWNMSPGLICGDFMFLTGFSGVGMDGTLPISPEMQIRNAFQTIALVLQEANLDFSSLVEMTSYHVGLQAHLELFKWIRNEYVQQPYPAWTAIEVTGLIQEGAMIEIRAIAAI